MTNDDLFDELRELSLDLRRYVITGSGPLGIRGIRPSQDLDLMVTDDLFGELAQHYTPEGGQITISERIEAFRESAFDAAPGVPPVEQQIADADLIDGLPFATLETVIAVKKSKGRPKDFADIELIRDWLSRQ